MGDAVGYYIVKLLVERAGLLGAPALRLNLGVDAGAGKVTGSGEITQSLPPPYGEITIHQLAGDVLHTGFGQDTRLVHLTGQYLVSVPPPAIGTYLAQFSAALAVDASWNGSGSFQYGTNTVSGCTVTNVSEEAKPLIGASATASA
ncbi:DUF1842 domain-containing protein [Sphingomonas hengshuiensis]|uniref:DUF1842 domain-containing protein n=1 Tax=Sphingomonas hengshuiensis TaxID=1609977 RepID=UPI0005CA78D9|nr:DUF1842 domain-containing protein [Sphingomonas hengshuiensis]